MQASVLIVDDHNGFRSLARRLLEADGYIIVGEAADGASAVAATEELRPDLVLLDVQLPDCNGIDVARQLLESSPRLHIVLISTRDARDYGYRLHQSGVRGFVTKSELSSGALTRLLELTR